MPTRSQLLLARKMRGNVKKLKDLGVPSKTIEKLVKSLNLPLGLQLNLLNVK